MRFGSVCSGIEAASVAWEPLGWKAAWFSEIDAAASAVLAYRFPEVVNLGDMLRLAARVRAREIEAPDILVGGTPCQAFSVAGLRKGLDDPRGQVTLAFVDLANAIDEIRKVDGKPPVIIVWENVPGVLNHKDNPFGCFLAGLAGEGDALLPSGKRWTNAGVVLGPQRAIAWRVQDAQYHGLAQRRRRVFLVASTREGFDPGAVLLEFDGLRRDSAPRRETGEGIAGTLDARTDGGGFPGTDGACSGHVVPAVIERSLRGSAELSVDLQNGALGEICGTLDSEGQSRGNRGHALLTERERESLVPKVSLCLNAGAMGRQDAESETLIPIIGAAFDDAPVTVVHDTQDPCTDDHLAFALGRNNGGENVIAFSSKDYGADAEENLSPTLRAGGHAESHANAGVPPAIAYAIQERAVCENPDAGPDGIGVRAVVCAYTLEARSVPQAVVIPFDTTQITSPGNYSSPKAGDMRHPLAAGAHPPAVCVTGAVTHTLKADGFDASEDGTGRGQPIVPAEPFNITPSNSNKDYNARPAEYAQALTTQSGSAPSSRGGTIIAEPVAMAVRRLMPVECERLQGFPDNWTRIPVRHYDQRKITKSRPAHLWEPDERGGWWLMAADGPRYKQLGNSMATKCMRWIGCRIAAQLAAISPPLGHNGGPALDPFEDLLA